MINGVKINIKRQIRNKNLTIGEVCKIMNKDRGFINRITGEVKLKKIIAIADAIGCKPGELLEGI